MLGLARYVDTCSAKEKCVFYICLADNWQWRTVVLTSGRRPRHFCLDSRPGSTAQSRCDQRECSRTQSPHLCKGCISSFFVAVTKYHDQKQLIEECILAHGSRRGVRCDRGSIIADDRSSKLRGHISTPTQEGEHKQ